MVGGSAETPLLSLPPFVVNAAGPWQRPASPTAIQGRVRKGRETGSGCAESSTSCMSRAAHGTPVVPGRDTVMAGFRKHRCLGEECEGRSSPPEPLEERLQEHRR